MHSATMSCPVPKHSSAALFSAIALDRTSQVPLYQQLSDELRQAVLTGRLSAGVRLPSTRTLATDMELSRNTVMIAFEQLLAEGYLEGKIGSGTFVASKLPDDMMRARAPEKRPRLIGRSSTQLSKRGATLLATHFKPPAPWMPVAPRPFRTGLPALDAVPIEIWIRLMARRLKQNTIELLSYGDPAGYRPLREAIADYVKAARGVRCDADQVIVVSGSQQGLDLAARLLLDPGDSAWIEDPGYRGARGALIGAGAKLIPVPVDAEGLDVDAGRARGPEARLLYVTPSHQYPLGVTMSLARRLALLEWASQSGAWILEDDYASQYRYSGRPLACLQGLDTRARVIYVGTFSKVLFPSLRLGYLVVPPDLVKAFVAARALADWHSPLVEQAALADFIVEGHFERHVRRMRRLYAERQGFLVEAAARHLEGLVKDEPGRSRYATGGLAPRWDRRSGSFESPAPTRNRQRAAVGVRFGAAAAAGSAARLRVS